VSPASTETDCVSVTWLVPLLSTMSSVTAIVPFRSPTLVTSTETSSSSPMSIVASVPWPAMSRSDSVDSAGASMSTVVDAVSLSVSTPTVMVDGVVSSVG